MRPIIHSVKHYVQFPIDQISTGARQIITLATAVESTLANLSTEVPEGTLVKAVYVELWLDNQSNLGESIVILEKTVAGQTPASFSNMGNLFAYENKKNILFTHQGLTSNDVGGNPVNIMRAWFKIPKGKQRMGLGDSIEIVIANVSANNLNRCGFAIYKEYS